jgi:hypothetical protein
MDEKTLQAIKERAKAADFRTSWGVGNAQLLKSVRSDIPALVEEVRRLREDGERLAKVADALNAYHNGSDPDGGLCIQQIAAALGKPF